MLLMNTSKKYHLQPGKKANSSSEKNPENSQLQTLNSSASDISMDDSSEEDKFLENVKMGSASQKAEKNSSQSEDLFSDVSDGDSDINSFTVSNNSPVLRVNKQQNVQENPFLQVPPPLDENMIPVPDLPEEEEIVPAPLKLEFQLPPLQPVDDSYYDKLLQTEFTDENLLAHAKQ